MCSEYFRPGSLPPAGGHDTQEESPNGTAGSSAGEPGGADSDEETAALRLAMLRADYVNSLNAFNQLPVSTMCWFQLPQLPSHAGG